MKAVQSVSGQELKEMLATATNWLEKSAPDIDALNVFPVPDGDTGTNMLLTLTSAYNEVKDSGEKHFGKMAGLVAKGALMGARGNSGVILSQLWRGFARALHTQTAQTQQLGRLTHVGAIHATSSWSWVTVAASGVGSWQPWQESCSPGCR